MPIVTYLAELIHSQFEHRAPKPIPEGLEIETLINVSIENQMDLIVIRALLQFEGLRDGLNSYHELAIKRYIMSCQQMEELKKLHRLFEDNAVKNQPMKGAIIRQYYPLSELRQMSDIDILVETADLDRVRNILKNMGYDLISQENHHDTYTKNPFMRIEIHHSLYDDSVDMEQGKYFGTFKRSILIEGSQYTYGFTNEDFYIYMMAHMAKHFYKMGCGIRYLMDIYVFRHHFKEALDEVYIEKELERNGLDVFTKHMEKLTNIWLNDEESSEFYDDLIGYMLESGIYGKDENGIWNKFAKAAVSDTRWSKFKLKLWYYFPPIYYMKDYYPWLEKNPWLLVFAWMIRGISGLFGHKGRHKRELLRYANSEEIGTMQHIYREMQLDFRIK